MAFLHRYSIRQQAERLISIDALNAAHAKALAEEDVFGMEDAEKIKATTTTLTQTNVGGEGGQTLDRFDVLVRFRRNISIDAENLTDAKFWANDDQTNFGDTVSGSVQHQGILFMRQNTGEA